MKKSELQLRKLVREELLKQEGLISEGWFTSAFKNISDLGGMLSGTSGMRKTVEEKTSPDAWAMFKAMIGPGADGDKVRKILFKRKDDLKKLSSEFDDLIKLAIESLKMTDADKMEMGIGKGKGDDADFVRHMGTAAFVVGGIAAIVSGTGVWAVVGLVIKAIYSGMGKSFELANDTKKSRNSVGMGKVSKKRQEQRAELKGARSGWSKVYTKVAGTIKDQPLSEYLANNGFKDEAEVLKKAVGGDKEAVPDSFKESTMRVSKSRLRKVIREQAKRALMEKPFRMPDSYYDPPDEEEIPDEIYDDLDDIFERAARSPDKRYKFVGVDGDYILVDETETVGDALPLYTLIDPKGRDEDFYQEEKQDVSRLEDRIIDILMKNYLQNKADMDADYQAERWD